MSKAKFNIKEIEYNEDKFGSTFLKLEISGPYAHHTILNSIRKIAINQIPIYAFHPDKINILRNNSTAYDNSYMRLRLSQLPIKFFHNTNFLPLKYYKEVQFNDPKYERHPNDTNDIEYYVKAKNVGPDNILNVNTSDLQISINNEKIENSKIYLEKFPLLLIKLRQGEEFECSMKAVLSIGEYDSIFNSSNTYYEQISENKYYLMIESSGQFTEYQILEKSIDILIEKLETIKDNIKNNQYQIIITENKSLMLEILNEDFTCGGCINYVLQSMPNVLFSGVTTPDFMQKNISFKIKVDNKSDPFEVFIMAIDECILIYKDFISNIVNINNKVIQKEEKISKKKKLL